MSCVSDDILSRIKCDGRTGGTGAIDVKSANENVCCSSDLEREGEEKAQTPSIGVEVLCDNGAGR